MSDLLSKYKITPAFRLTTRCLAVNWHCVDVAVLEHEATIVDGRRHAFYYRGTPQVLLLYMEGHLDIVYQPETDFECRGIQKWLQERICDVIWGLAETILPARLHFWEQQKGMKAKGVSVKPMRRGIMGYCTHNNHIALAPYLVLFKQEWLDGVILHEMAHFRHKHHRKSFWNHLSTLIGEDSKLAKVKHDIAISPYFDYFCFLTNRKQSRKK